MARKRTSENSDPSRPKKTKNNNIKKSQNENTQSLDLQFQSLLQKHRPLRTISANVINTVSNESQIDHSSPNVTAIAPNANTEKDVTILTTTIVPSDLPLNSTFVGESEFPDFESCLPPQFSFADQFSLSNSNSQKTKPKKAKKATKPKQRPETNENPLKVNGRLPLPVKREILELCIKSASETVDGKPKFSEIARKYGIARQSLAEMYRKRDIYLNHISKNPFSKATMVSKKRNPIIEIMEDTLIFWIDWMNSNRARLCKLLIQEKAREIVENYRKQLGLTEEIRFDASNGWFWLFCKRNGLRSIKCSGESACVDPEVVNNFVVSFNKLIIDRGYHPKQVFNVDELGLFWKLISDHTYAPGYIKFVAGSKKAKQRVTMMIGCNAFGDFALKPLLIGHSKTPRAFSHAGINRENLPLIYRSNERSAWMTTFLFREWFTQYFVPAVMDYLKKEGLPQKALLILDNAPVHPKDLGIDHPDIEIVYMPPNCSCILQPMDQAPIKAFKSYYVRSTMKECNKSLSEKHLVPEQFWKEFTILDCIKYAYAAWKEVKLSTWRKSWKKVWPTIEDDCARYECETLAEEECIDICDELKNDEFYKQNFEMVTDEIDYELLNCEQMMHIRENIDLVGNIDGSLLEIETVEMSSGVEDSDNQFGIQVFEDAFVCEPVQDDSHNDLTITRHESTIQNETRNSEKTCCCRITCGYHSALVLGEEIRKKMLDFQTKHKFDINITLKCKK